MSLSTVMVLGGLVGAALLAAVATAARRPAARRLGARSAVRHPTESVLVILGALLGTAIITGSLIVGDTLRASLRAGAFTQLGPVDETVTAPGVEALPALRDALSGLEDDAAVDGVAFALRAGGTAAARVGSDDPAVQPDVMLLELEFTEARGLAEDAATTGLVDASTPSQGEAAISADLARALDVDVGDQLVVFAYGSTQRLRVSGVLPRRGIAGYSTGLDARSLNVFVAPDTIEELVAGADAQQRVSPPIALAFVSNEGDVLAGTDRTGQVTRLIEQRLASLPQAGVEPSKQQVLDTAEEIGGNLTEVFMGIGAFAVIAGILLLVNVFVMLAQERRSQLGIMRAVGMQRGAMVQAFFLEGSLYAVVAAALGAVAGLGVGAAIVRLARGISGGPAGFTLELRFAAEPSSLVGGLLVGLLISLATILIASVRISRLNIIRAIRQLPEPPPADRRMRRLIMGWAATLSGAALSAVAVGAQAGAGLFVGPALLASGLAALLGLMLGRRRSVTVLGLLLVIWGVAAPTLVPDAFRDADVILFVLQGLVVTGAAVVVLARNQDTVGRLVRTAAGGTGSVTARLGLAYPLARPFRTTMTLAMYALVVFTLVLMSLLTQVFDGQTDAFADAESGGYDLLVSSTASDPLPPQEVRQRDDVEHVAPLRHAAFSVEFRARGTDEFRRWFASGYDHQLLRVEPPALDRWLPRFEQQEAVWQHVLDDRSAMIIGSQFLREGGTPQTVQLGDTIEIRDPITGDVGERDVVGVLKGGLAFSGAFMSEDSLVSVLGHRAVSNRLYVAVDEAADPGQVAANLEEGHLAHGVEARTFRAVVAERQQSNLQFLRILQGYLMLGLLIGTAGLGVVMVRAVRERRAEIGMLRSIGLQPQTVGHSFMLEAGFIAMQGVVVGAALGAATAYQLIGNAAAFGGLEVRFVVPWTEIAILLTIILLASIGAAAWPARRASRIRPAVALRGLE